MTFLWIMLGLMLAFFAAVWLLITHADMRCEKPGCFGKMERLGTVELDEYLDSASPLPDDTVMVPMVPDVYRCVECGHVVEIRE